jgi:hypothetical protein
MKSLRGGGFTNSGHIRLINALWIVPVSGICMDRSGLFIRTSRRPGVLFDLNSGILVSA